LDQLAQAVGDAAIEFQTELELKLIKRIKMAAAAPIAFPSVKPEHISADA
jgi:hypothetical protein